MCLCGSVAPLCTLIGIIDLEMDQDGSGGLAKSSSLSRRNIAKKFVLSMVNQLANVTITFCAFDHTIQHLSFELFVLRTLNSDQFHKRVLAVVTRLQRPSHFGKFTTCEILMIGATMWRRFAFLVVNVY